jgi:hypothetical protein
VVSDGPAAIAENVAEPFGLSVPPTSELNVPELGKNPDWPNVLVSEPAPGLVTTAFRSMKGSDAEPSAGYVVPIATIDVQSVSGEVQTSVTTPSIGLTSPALLSDTVTELTPSLTVRVGTALAAIGPAKSPRPKMVKIFSVTRRLPDLSVCVIVLQRGKNGNRKSNNI